MAWFEDYGRLVPRSEVTEAFNRYEIKPETNYYFSGSDVWPDAIIGVNKAYTLDSTLWRKITATPAVLKNLVSGMKSRPTSDTAIRRFAILDNKGRQIGSWFSSLASAHTYVRMVNEKAVEIRTPIRPSRPHLGG